MYMYTQEKIKVKSTGVFFEWGRTCMACTNWCHDSYPLFECTCMLYKNVFTYSKIKHFILCYSGFAC